MRSNREKHTNQSSGKKDPPSGKKERTQSSCTPVVNKPKNYFILDATVPFEFCFYRFGSKVSVTVHQTPAEELWPGGALWDLGVLLSQILVFLTREASLTASNRVDSDEDTARIRKLIPFFSWKHMSVLELGCGVGLTGLVAAALGARTVILTDLQHVVDGITYANMKLNNALSGGATSKIASNHAGGHVMAVPLCWGNEDDEQVVMELLNKQYISNKQQRCTRRQKKPETKPDDTTRHSAPVDLVLIGDVAYQHKPGAPSHFDALVSTLMKFVSKDTLVIFGTRMRMPASADLLHMLREHLEEVVVPPLHAHEINSRLEKNNNMTIHFLKKRVSKSNQLL